MIKKLINAFSIPDPAVIAQRELQEAKRSLLQAQSAHEYAESLARYHAARIQRLTQYLKENT